MFPQTIEAGGKSITTPQNICNEINNHFVKIGEKLAAKSSIHHDNQHFKFLGKRNVYHQLYFNHLTHMKSLKL